MTDGDHALSWGHININVSDLDRSVEFYEMLGFEMFIPTIPYLGLTATPTMDVIPGDCAQALDLEPGIRGRACIMQLGSGFPKLDLTEFAISSRRDPLTNADLGLVRFCLASRDLQADYARLSSRGVEFRSAPQVGTAGLAEIAICADPDGTLIELIQLHLEKWSRPDSAQAE